MATGIWDLAGKILVLAQIKPKIRTMGAGDEGPQSHRSSLLKV